MYDDPEDIISRLKRALTDFKENPRDEYHTMKELYHYRMLYNAMAFKFMKSHFPIVKSKNHSDGTPCFDGEYFIVVAILPTGQVSNHYKLKYWDLFDISEVNLPPEYDGHTPEIAAQRMEDFLDSNY